MFLTVREIEMAPHSKIVDTVPFREEYFVDADE